MCSIRLNEAFAVRRLRARTIRLSTSQPDGPRRTDRKDRSRVAWSCSGWTCHDGRLVPAPWHRLTGYLMRRHLRSGPVRSSLRHPIRQERVPLSCFRSCSAAKPRLGRHSGPSQHDPGQRHAAGGSCRTPPAAPRRGQEPREEPRPWMSRCRGVADLETCNRATMEQNTRVNRQRELDHLSTALRSSAARAFPLSLATLLLAILDRQNAAACSAGAPTSLRR